MVTPADPDSNGGITSDAHVEESIPDEGSRTGDFCSFGEYLKRQRELRGISVAEIARVTRINQRYLVALEEGRQDVLPARPFVKGFLAAYAKHVGLAAEEVLSRYDEAGARAEPRDEKGPAAEPRTPSGAGGRPAAAVALLVALAGVSALLMMRRPTAEEPPAAEVREPAPEGRGVPVTPPAASPEGGAGAGTAGEGQAAFPAPVEPVAGIRLSLAAAEKTWVYAVLDEQTVRDFFLQPGERVELEADRLVSLTLGNAGGVAVTLNGRELDPLGRRGEVKRDVLFSWDPRLGAALRETTPDAEAAGR